jgi:ribosome-binding factor A
MSPSHHSGRGRRREPSQRQLRIGELVRHTLSGILARGEAHDPDLQGRSITVTEAQVGGDLKQAIIYVTPLACDPASSKAVETALNRCAAFLRGRLGHSIELRHTPMLKFVLDERFDKAAALDALLRDPRVASDLKPEGDS